MDSSQFNQFIIIILIVVVIVLVYFIFSCKSKKIEGMQHLELMPYPYKTSRAWYSDSDSESEKSEIKAFNKYENTQYSKIKKGKKKSKRSPCKCP